MCDMTHSHVSVLYLSVCRSLLCFASALQKSPHNGHADDTGAELMGQRGGGGVQGGGDRAGDVVVWPLASVQQLAKSRCGESFRV